MNRLPPSATPFNPGMHMMMHSQQFYQQAPPFGAMMAPPPRMPYPAMMGARPPMMGPGPQYPMPYAPYAMPPQAFQMHRPPTMPDMTGASISPTRTGTAEELDAFQARLKSLPPALELTPQAKSAMNLRTIPVDRVAIARYLFAILRKEVSRDGSEILASGPERSAISQSRTGGECLEAMDCLTLAGLRRKAKDDSRIFQKVCDQMGDQLATKPSRSLVWFSLSPFSSKRMFYKVDKQLSVEGHTLQALLAVGNHEDGEAESTGDPFLRDDANAYLSRILQRITVETGEPLEILPPRTREISGDAADVVSILGMCFKEYAAELIRQTIEKDSVGG